jgi:hypothetical protein
MPDFPYVPPESPMHREQRQRNHGAELDRHMASSEYESLLLLKRASPLLRKYGRGTMKAIEYERRSFPQKKLTVIGGWVIGAAHSEPSGYTQEGAGTYSVLYGEDDRLHAGVPFQRRGVEIIPSTLYLGKKSTVSEYLRKAESNHLTESILNTDSAIVRVMLEPEHIRAMLNGHLSDSGQSV